MMQDTLNLVVATVTQILVHSLWQGGIIALLLAAALFFLKNADARLRYALSCLALASVIAWCALTGFYFSMKAEWTAVPDEQQAVVQDSADSHATVASLTTSSELTGEFYRLGNGSLYRWLFPVWAIGVVLLSAYHMLGWRRMSRLTRRGTDNIPPAWKERFANLCEEMRLMKTVGVVGSSRISVPCVFGWVKPVVLLPVSIFSGLGAAEIEMIVVHELAHVRRNDILVNILQTAAETLLFFNPAVWWISRQIRAEREHCCDDAVVACRQDKLGYARALASLEEWRAVSGGFVAAAGSSSLLWRIRRIVGATTGRTRPVSVGVAGIFLFAVLLGAGMVLFGGPAQEVRAQTTLEKAENFEKQSGDINGRWEIESDGRRTHIDMRFGRRMNVGFTVRNDELSGTIDENTTYARIIRDAGTFHLVGKFDKDDDGLWGRGELYFRANPDYIKEMESMGFDLGDDEDVLSLAVHNVTLDYTRGMEELGYDDLSLNKLVEAHIHDVTPEFIREFIELGYKDLKIDRLIEMSIHDADPDFVRGLAEYGYRDLPARKLVEMRIHDADPDFVAGLAEVGYTGLDPSRLVELRIHDVTPEYIRRLSEFGYKDITAAKLVEMRIHDVSPDYIRQLTELGYNDLSPSKLVEMKIHDVSPSYIRELAELGYKDISPSRLVEMCIHDVSPRFIRKLQEKGYDDLSPRELVDFKIHGDW